MLNVAGAAAAIGIGADMGGMEGQQGSTALGAFSLTASFGGFSLALNTFNRLIRSDKLSVCWST